MLCVKSLQSCPTLWNPTDCILPGSSVHGILQARILEWVAISSFKGSSWSKYQIRVSYVSCIGRQMLAPPGKDQTWLTCWWWKLSQTWRTVPQSWGPIESDQLPCETGDSQLWTDSSQTQYFCVPAESIIHYGSYLLFFNVHLNVSFWGGMFHNSISQNVGQIHLVGHEWFRIETEQTWKK